MVVDVEDYRRLQAPAFFIMDNPLSPLLPQSYDVFLKEETKGANEGQRNARTPTEESAFEVADDANLTADTAPLSLPAE
jgi:hypothetical protein